MEEQILYTKYALLSFSDYFKLNKTISEFMGFMIGDATARYTDAIPKLAKVNIQIVDGIETYDTLAVMQISVNIQKNLSGLLEGLELVDSYIPADDVLTVEAIGLNTEQIDYTLNHIADVNPTIEIIQLESEPRSAESDLAVEKLVGEGKTIITVL